MAISIDYDILRLFENVNIRPVPSNSQYDSDIAVGLDGNAWIAWGDEDNTPDSSEVILRQIGMDGTLLGVQRGIGGNDIMIENPSVSVLDTGVAIFGYETNLTGNDNPVFGTRPDPATTVITVNTLTTALDQQINVDVAALSGSLSAIVYVDEGALPAEAEIKFRVGTDTSFFTSINLTVGTTLLTEDRAFEPKVAAMFDPLTAAKNDNAVIVWTQLDGDQFAIKARLYDIGFGTAAPLTSEIDVSTDMADGQFYPVVTGLADGGFAVAWMDQYAGTNTFTELETRIYNADGTARTGVIAFEAPARIDEIDIAEVFDGIYAITYVTDAGGDENVRAKLISAAAGEELLDFVVTAESGRDAESSIASLRDGTFFASWTDFNTGIPESLVQVSRFEVTKSETADSSGDIFVGDALKTAYDGANSYNTIAYANSGEGIVASLEAGVGFGGDAAGDTYEGFISVLEGTAFDDVLVGQADGSTSRVIGGAGNDRLSVGTDYPAIQLNPGITTNDRAEIFGFGMPTGDLTLEMLFRSDIPFASLSAEQIFGSYLVPSNNNELLLFGVRSGDYLQVTIGGTAIDTTVTISQLFDGDTHRLSVVYDDTVQTLAVYVDGVQQWSSAMTGVDVEAGGTLMFGQEQDGGGSLDPNQILNGDLSDIRIFDTARSEQQVIDNAFIEITDPMAEPGLVANWRPELGNTATVPDAIGGTALTLVNGVGVDSQTTSLNYLEGGIGDDELHGNDGRDVASVRNADAGTKIDLQFNQFNTGEVANDLFISIEGAEGSAFADDLRGDAGNNSLLGRDGNDVLNGRGGEDLLLGDDGDDVLIGGAGADNIRGGNGIDRAQYTTATSAVIASLANFSINTGDAEGDTYDRVENLTGSNFDDGLFGDEFANRIDGLAGSDTLLGRDGNDMLVGGAGNDFLSGDGGADQLFGGAGSDIAQYLGSASVTADLQNSTLNVGANAIGDTYSQVENIVSGSGNDSLRGNGLGNLLNGGGGDDILIGRNGDDILRGSNGDDALTGGNGADSMDGGNGIDRAQYTEALSGVKADLLVSSVNTGIAAGDTYLNVENLRGSQATDDLRGDNGNNLLEGLGGNDNLFGRSGNDVLRGGAGDDLLRGGLGDDTLIGSTGSDRFRFNGASEGNDIIQHFQINVDTIQLNDLGFTGLTTGALSAANFVIGAAALDADDYIVYDAGALYYDGDGSGANAAVQFATVLNAAAIDEEDFFVV